RARGRSFAGGGFAACTGIESQPHSAANIYGSSDGFTSRRRGGIVGERGVVACAEHVAAGPSISQLTRDGQCGRQCLLGRLVIVVGEWILVWRGPSAAGAPHQSLRGGEVRIIGERRATNYSERPVARRPDRYLCVACHLFAGCGAGIGALVERQL